MINRTEITAICRQENLTLKVNSLTVIPCIHDEFHVKDVGEYVVASRRFISDNDGNIERVEIGLIPLTEMKHNDE